MEGEGWVPPSAAWQNGREATNERHSEITRCLSFVASLPFYRPGGNAGPQPSVSVPPCLPVNPSYETALRSAATLSTRSQVIALTSLILPKCP